jgi:hypothetical protein
MLTMTTDTQTIKIRRSTHRQIKILAAQNGETMMDFLDRLVTEAAKRTPKPAIDSHISVRP